jgi:hypothetical protein
VPGRQDRGSISGGPALTPKTPPNVAQSVRQRLKNVADVQGRPFSEVLQWYAIERFIARLSRTPHAEDMLLKGAALMRAWEATPTRPTMDVDLAAIRVLSVDEVIAAICTCLLADVGPDGLDFDLDSVRGEEIRVARRHPGVRVRCRGFLGTARVSLQVDVGFGDRVVPPPTMIEYPTILDERGPRLLGYRPETVVAEKLEAIVDLGMATSRMKDYFDVWWLLTTRSFDGVELSSAIAATFENRETRVPNGVPEGLSARVATDDGKLRQWAAFVKRMRLESDSPHFSEVVGIVREFSRPLFEALHTSTKVDLIWKPAGPWINTGA